MIISTGARLNDTYDVLGNIFSYVDGFEYREISDGAGTRLLCCQIPEYIQRVCRLWRNYGEKENEKFWERSLDHRWIPVAERLTRVKISLNPSRAERRLYERALTQFAQGDTFSQFLEKSGLRYPVPYPEGRSAETKDLWLLSQPQLLTWVDAVKSLEIPVEFGYAESELSESERLLHRLLPDGTLLFRNVERIHCVDGHLPAVPMGPVPACVQVVGLMRRFPALDHVQCPLGRYAGEESGCLLLPSPDNNRVEAETFCRETDRFVSITTGGNPGQIFKFKEIHVTPIGTCSTESEWFFLGHGVLGAVRSVFAGVQVVALILLIFFLTSPLLGLGVMVLLLQGIIVALVVTSPFLPIIIAVEWWHGGEAAADYAATRGMVRCFRSMYRVVQHMKSFRLKPTCPLSVSRSLPRSLARLSGRIALRIGRK